MSLRPLSISENRAKSLDKLISVSEAKLAALREALAHVSTLLRIADFQDILRRHLDQKDVRDVARLLLSLRRYADGRDVGVTEVFGALVEGLKVFGWPEEKITTLVDRRSLIEGILNLEAIHCAYKLGDLYFSHERHLHDASILTEMRPVFDSSRKVVKGYILYSSLRLVYSDRFEKETMLTIAMKRQEIEGLRDECNRALAKISVVEDDLKKRGSLDIVSYSGSFTEHD